jgi:rhodanese-related sulfurtransferase
MTKMKLHLLILAAAISLGVPVKNAVAEEEPPVCFYESRRGINVECGIYKSEVSPAKAYLDTLFTFGKWRGRPRGPVILDVRSIPEYKAGHPKGAYNVPYPFINEVCGGDGSRRPDGACITRGTRTPQSAEDFVAYVEQIIPDKHTPIYTLCRTGSRSVGAANRLAEIGYKNVSNIWEGFVGVYLNAPQYVFDENGDQVFWDDDGDPSTDEVPLVENLPVDLNHDGQLTDADKNGWVNHQDLPYVKTLLPWLIYKPYASDYKW